MRGSKKNSETSAKSKPRRGRKSKVAQQELLLAALKLFAKNGYSETSFQEIADRFGISQQAILYHFPNKLALIEAVIKLVVAHNHSIVSQSTDLDDNAVVRLKKHFEKNLDWAVTYREESQIILLLYYLASYHPQFTSMYQTILSNARRRISEWVAAGKREGLVRKELDTVYASERLHDSLLGGIVNLLTTGGGKKEAALLVKHWEQWIGELLT